ncbi:hypothetical protein CPAST_c11090 [Clostridium pasteurianum DSM 525 = ATCC 6013]|uniref:dihydrouracil dehydrogenase (NAD(+)) n=1 Tax=Clostridium pasteurianum DSM 525 = ATCC 6013 TaxID=1262449 RepID=A0A0H3J1F1_CLOPA|nr:hypothetical protein [Clostridium pasteurianum]AJA47209.1 hypothetical protein CPAST_c11090 [Clostridium pasteurianum DSM 525 = ATCC 6013]AJA51197.1 hypothetical protein CLPA_c11090 [Clostridium pasteurianum DSM 525 = ATCC 6013]AOZ74563.1 hypothetical protein AQ983_05370 [Clostridium pasteurianum DSM 525 = ATCC 6013]AOZ78360.1 hypothetical protein AQ984_05360 [Clostridium pasteurianum]ELP59406.1 hypothetical protein F502_08983 [Clostridium pasteurianum DSM 525 = ATCC 6013]
MIKKKVTKTMIIEETARCLLCYDAPCSKACPAEFDPAKNIRSVRFQNFRGSAESVKRISEVSGKCGEACNKVRFCQRSCIRGKIDRPIQINMVHEFLTEGKNGNKEDI